jgi:tripartite ATP-independent transporter DctP family solute receptor
VRCRQLHNQPPGSPLDRWLRRLWDDVRAETSGRLDVEVSAQNGGVAGGDPAALEMLRAGEVAFFTLMGGLLGRVAPVAEIQNVPFAFGSQAQVFAAVDGDLGAHLREEVAAKGVYMIPRGCFENGFRHITTRTRAVRSADDLVGLRIRTPAGRLFVDFFTTLGAEPTAINLDRLYQALKDGAVDAQENPLVMVEVNRLDEVQTHLSLTGHMWSGFNLLANLALWRSLPGEVQGAVERAAARCAAGQRAETEARNAALAEGLRGRGLLVNRADTTDMRRRLGDFYARWKREFGAKAWGLLQAHAGTLP